MRPVILAAGGTGGHMFPAEALAGALHGVGSRVLLVTDARGLRYAGGFPPGVETLPTGGGRWRQTAHALPLALRLAAIRPGTVVGFGGYPSLPALCAARILGVPFILHEQNAVLGRVNRAFAARARAVVCGFAQTALMPPGATMLHYGNPVRAATRKAAKEWRPFAEGGAIHLLAFGGSQGAHAIAQAVPRALARLPESMRARIRLCLQARVGDESAARESCERAGIEADVRPFFSDLPQKMAQAHLVVSRAGAMSLAELAAMGRPSILMPYGFAANDHQNANAALFVRAKAARVMQDPRATPEALGALFRELLDAPALLAAMAQAARSLDRPRAVADLARLVRTHTR